MKIKVYVLEELEDDWGYSYWVTRRLTIDKEEAQKWGNESCQTYEEYELTIPEEIKAQKDY